MAVLTEKREARIREKFGWHSKGDPCKCDGCLLLAEVDHLRVKVDELEEIVADIVVNEVKEGKGHTAECGVPYIPCNGKCGAVKEPEVVMDRGTSCLHDNLDGDINLVSCPCPKCTPQY